MRKVFSLSQCFLFCAAILFSFKSFAEGCPVVGTGITGSTTCTGDITTTESYIDRVPYGLDSSDRNTKGIFLDNSGTSSNNTVNLTGNITTSGGDADGIHLENRGGSHTNTVNMTGNLETRARHTYGIYIVDLSSSISSSNTVNLTGNLSTLERGAHGIYYQNSSTGTSNITTVNMTGNLTTSGSVSGDRATGIYFYEAGTSNTTTVNLTGNLTTSGATCYCSRHLFV